MSISAADVSAITQARIDSDVSIAVARKIQDQQKQQGQSALDLLATAADAGPSAVHPSNAWRWTPPG